MPIEVKSFSGSDLSASDIPVLSLTDSDGGNLDFLPPVQDTVNPHLALLRNDTGVAVTINANQPVSNRNKPFFNTASFPADTVALIQYSPQRNGWALIGGDIILANAASGGAPFSGASAAANGAGGTVTIPNAGQQDLILHGDANFREKLPTWTSGDDYSQGAVVLEGTTIYKRTGAAITNSTTLPSADGGWTLVGGGAAVAVPAYDFASSTAGIVTPPAAGNQDQVLRGDGAFDVELPAWVSGQAYSVNAKVLDGNSIFRRLSAGSSATAPSGDPGNWVELGPAGGVVNNLGAAGSGTAGIVTPAATNQDDFVLHGDADFREKLPAWVSGTTYAPGAVVVDGSALFKRTGAVAVSNTAPGSDGANWEAIGSSGGGTIETISGGATILHDGAGGSLPTFADNGSGTGTLTPNGNRIYSVVMIESASGGTYTFIHNTGRNGFCEAINDNTNSNQFISFTQDAGLTQVIVGSLSGTQVYRIRVTF